MAMSALGHKRTYALQKAMSALPPKADMCGGEPMSASCHRRTFHAASSRADHTVFAGKARFCDGQHRLSVNRLTSRMRECKYAAHSSQITSSERRFI